MSTHFQPSPQAARKSMPEAELRGGSFGLQRHSTIEYRIKILWWSLMHGGASN
jgi:ferritin-like metal-binding protein YciE